MREDCLVFGFQSNLEYDAYLASDTFKFAER